MRKQVYLAALAALAGALVCSCEREKDVKMYSPEAGYVGLVMDGVDTRSAVSTPIARNTYLLGKDESGVSYALMETVEELGDVVAEAPETRGTPAYTENVISLYGNQFNGVVYGPSGQVAGDDAFEVMTGTGSDIIWRRYFGFDPWDQAGGDPTFFLHMPSTLAGVTNLAYNYSAESIAFDFQTQASAPAQKDILFAARTISKSAYESEFASQGGASVLFRHALTGVKFAIGNNDNKNGIRTFITKVEITGLKDKGHAVFKPTGTETTKDNRREFSSQKSFTWTDGSTSPVTTTKYTQTFSKTDIQNYTSGDAVGAAPSFYTGGEKNNLNLADASLTFWFVPQQISNKVTVTVTFFLQKDGVDGQEQTLTLDLGKAILAQTAETNKVWKAGQLRTFTLQPDVVDVDIHDKVTEFIKDNVVIRNTGNTDAYIRAYIVANWYGKNDSNEDGIAIGYTSSAHTAFVDAWQRNGTTGDNFGGVFTGLPGSGWVLKSDGFFYYTQKVAAGAVISPTLFEKYQLNITAHPVPHIWYLSIQGGYKEFTDVRLVMEIPVQAIDANLGSTWQSAWEAAGVTF